MSDQLLTKAAPGPEHRLMNSVRVQLQFAGQSGWCNPLCQTEKHRALRGSEVRIHHLLDHPGEIPCLSFEVGARVCRGKFVPELWRERHARAASPHVLAKLGDHLEDDEPGGPGREPAFATKVSDLADDEEQGVGCRLAGQIVEVRAGDAQVKASLARLTPRSAKQDLVEFLAGSLVPRAGAGQTLDPLLIIDRTGRANPCPGLGAVQVHGRTAHDDAHPLHLAVRTACQLGGPAGGTMERYFDSIGWVLPNRPERFWAPWGSTVHHDRRT
jgi:hypothetical protein